MDERYLWVILAVPLGCFVLALVAVLVIFNRRRCKRRMRGFSLRAVTPLDDAEFESWRRPSQHAQRPERYGIRSSTPRNPSAVILPSMIEKAYAGCTDARPPSPQAYAIPTSPTSPIRKPERVRRKSSVCSSLADRPPTPYSPASTSSEHPRSSLASSKSPFGSPRFHYPSMSETSAFHFDLAADLDHQDRIPMVPSSPSDRPFRFVRGHNPYYDKI